MGGGSSNGSSAVPVTPAVDSDRARALLAFGTGGGQASAPSGVPPRVSLQIDPNDEIGIPHPDFRNNIVALLDQIEGTEEGRKLVTELYNGPHQVTIKASLPVKGGAYTEPLPSWLHYWNPRLGNLVGRRVIIHFDAYVTDRDIQVRDKNLKLIPQPRQMLLIHELIHALHITTGTVEARPSRSRDFIAADSGEEEKTILTGHPSENQFRLLYKYAPRRGDDGIDLRKEFQ